MNMAEFNTQLDRLRDAFTDKPFSDQRVKLIWREVQPFDARWLLNLVDRMLSSERYAPMPNAFAEAAAIERERIWALEKAKERREVGDMMSKVPPDEQGSIFKAISDLAKGYVAETDKAPLLKALRGLGDTLSPVSCRRCEDTGVQVWDEPYGAISRTVASRCSCDRGRKHPSNFSVIPNEFM